MTSWDPPSRETLDEPSAPEVSGTPGLGEAPDGPEAADEPDDADEAVEVAERSPGTTRRLVVLVSALGAAALALSLVLAAVLSDRSDLRDELDDQQAVAEVAGTFAAAVSAFDHADLDARRAAVAELATDGFLAEYESALSGELRQRLLDQQVVIQPTVQDVYVGSLGAAQATAVVELDLAYRTTEGPFDVASTFVLLNLVRTPEGWRVEGVETLRQGVDTRLSELLGQDGEPAEEGSGDGAPPAAPGGSS